MEDLIAIPTLAAQQPTDEPGFQKLAPAARWVRLFTGLIGTVFFGILILVADVALLSHSDRWPFDAGTLSLVIVPLLLVWDLIYPFLWYRCWRWVQRERDLLVVYGVFWRVKRSVPLDRIQHVDIKAGPIDRSFGLASLTLYTAGSGDEDMEIPGLVVEVAEELRDRLLLVVTSIEPAESAEAVAPTAGGDEERPNREPGTADRV